MDVNQQMHTFEYHVQVYTYVYVHSVPISQNSFALALRSATPVLGGRSWPGTWQIFDQRTPGTTFVWFCMSQMTAVEKKHYNRVPFRTIWHRLMTRLYGLMQFLHALKCLQLIFRQFYPCNSVIKNGAQCLAFGDRHWIRHSTSKSRRRFNYTAQFNMNDLLISMVLYKYQIYWLYIVLRPRKKSSLKWKWFLDLLITLPNAAVWYVCHIFNKVH